ncbi:protein PTST homolog 3, chloroplastic [Aristolochia californica]|uniref:protein PTST homolog 3, chloroplastic n=1 Tax=Aristolochia californica TaxID=171875 RepID=UPI0035D8CA30
MAIPHLFNFCVIPPKCYSFLGPPFPSCRKLIISCSAEKSSDRGNKRVKASRPTKTNEELCRDLLEFISTVGLPEQSVPTIKELCQHGRKDLAYLVRRRGYKLMQELLLSASENQCIEVGNVELSSSVTMELANPKEPLAEIQDIESCLSNKSSGTLSVGNNHSLSSLDRGFLISSSNDDEEGRRCSERKVDIDFQNKGLPIETMPKLNKGRITSLEAAVDDNTNRNDHVSLDECNFLDIDKELAAEANEKDNLVEVDHLKAMLHQKELELFQLKKQIEKEKLGLAILQTKAKAEIGDAERIIAAKDTELVAAEESLCDLKEVRIEYQGVGEIVEVAGSFNGWHHRVKMDLQPSSETMQQTVPRKPLLWSTMLWLYPGIYEIKFVVDGLWMIDPQKECSYRGHIQNNILRVDR